MKYYCEQHLNKMNTKQITKKKERVSKKIQNGVLQQKQLIPDNKQVYFFSPLDVSESIN